MAEHRNEHQKGENQGQRDLIRVTRLLMMNMSERLQSQFEANTLLGYLLESETAPSRHRPRH